MKVAIFLCFLSVVGYSMASSEEASDEDAASRGCIYVLGKCHHHCGVGTHGYATGCGHKIPEATCDNPNPVAEEAIICDYSACYCDPPTVRDTTTDKCVPLNECPNKNEE